MHRPKTLRDIGWRLPNVLIGETGSITASRTQSHTEAVESDEKHKEAIGSVPNRLPMACRPVPTSRPQGLNGKRAGRIAAYEARDDVGRKACGKADDDAHRPGRIGLRPRDAAGSAAAPAAGCRNCRRGSFILNLPSRHSIGEGSLRG